jgi:Xaa-Pro aminopeptidase
VYAIAWNERTRDVDVVVPAALADLVTAQVAAHSRAHAYGSFVLEASPDADADARRVAALAAGSADGPLAALEQLLRGRLGAGGRVAVETAGFAPGLLDRLAAALPSVEFVAAEPLLATLRAVKSPREIDLLRGAAEIAESAVAASLATPVAGTAEADVAAAFTHALVRLGAQPQTTVLGTGPRSALPNALPTARPVAAGDVLRFDVGCRFGHYVSDIARTVAVGRATDEQRLLYAALSDGLERAAAELRPGVTAASVFDAAVAGVREGGLPGYRRTHCGHGIGIANYDLPQIAPGSEDVLEPGMVVCLETPYYRLGAFGLQVEDTFVVTETGADRVTRAPRELLLAG